MSPLELHLAQRAHSLIYKLQLVIIGIVLEQNRFETGYYNKGQAMLMLRLPFAAGSQGHQSAHIVDTDLNWQQIMHMTRWLYL